MQTRGCSELGLCIDIQKMTPSLKLRKTSQIKQEVFVTQTAMPDLSKMEASFSILVMSIASSAAMALGLTPNPQSEKVEVDKELARFNIDLLSMLQDKTKGRLTGDEEKLVTAILSDLQMKFVQMK